MAWVSSFDGTQLQHISFYFRRWAPDVFSWTNPVQNTRPHIKGHNIYQPQTLQKTFNKEHKYWLIPQKNIMQFKYKRIYDRKAKSFFLKLNDYCFKLQPLADHQGSKTPFREFRWSGPYCVDKVFHIKNISSGNSIRKKNSKIAIELRSWIRTTHDLIGCSSWREFKAWWWIFPQDDFYVITWEIDFGTIPDRIK